MGQTIKKIEPDGEEEEEEEVSLPPMRLRLTGDGDYPTYLFHTLQESGLNIMF